MNKSTNSLVLTSPVPASDVNGHDRKGDNEIRPQEEKTIIGLTSRRYGLDTHIGNGEAMEDHHRVHWKRDNIRG